MTKKLLRLIPPLIAIVAAIGVWYFTQKIPVGHRASNGIGESTSGASTSAPPLRKESKSVDSDSADESLSTELHGKGFTVNVTENSNPPYKNLAITLNDGKLINQLVHIDGSKTALENELFSSGDKFELKQLLPNVARDQLVLRGSAVLTDGYGILKNYAIYRVNDTGLTELIDLITERDFSGMNGQPAQKLTATVVERIENGQLSIVYQYVAEKSKPKTIIFRWNGNAFVDTSRKYKDLDQEYRP